jgi:hypothetical protein
MPLARIITRSHQCSRELALDLLARGYTVEVVSPDNIPDNIADLELRVDAGHDSQLIANVEFHDGDRSTSLDFVHYLKTPLADFVRRPPEIQEETEIQTIAIAFGGEASFDDLEMPAEVPHVATQFTEARVPVGHPRITEQNHTVVVERDSAEESAPLSAMAVPEYSRPEPHPAQSAMTESAIAHSDSLRLTKPAIVPPRTPKSRNHSANTNETWRWRPAFTVASAIVLALAVRFGINSSRKPAAENPNVAPVTKTTKIASTSTNVNSFNPVEAGNSAANNFEKDPRAVSKKDLAKIAVNGVPLPTTVSSGSTESVSNQSVTVKSEAVANRGGKGTSKSDDGLIARNTVTYLDKNFDKSATKSKHGKTTRNSAKNSATKSTPRHPNSSRHRADGIAADTVTYLDKVPTPKTTKQN